MISDAAHDLFRRLSGGAESFALTTHVNPDGDALGSQLSLARYLMDQGKRVRIVNHDPTSEALRFIERDDVRLEIYDPDVHDDELRAVDMLILVDNSAPDRLGGMESMMLTNSQRTLCIDHHPSRGTPWKYHILDEGACATTVMIYELTTRQGWTPDRLAAEAIYVGLATDTGFFRFNSANPEAYDVAAALLRLGAQPARTYQEIYERNSLAFTRLLGHALSGVQLFADGAVASVRITAELMARLNAEDVDTSEIMTALLAMDGIRVALLFRELEGGKVKVSLRSKGDIDVHRLAGEFGGGGHRNASGIVTDGSLDEVIRTVIGRASQLT